MQHDRRKKRITPGILLGILLVIGVRPDAVPPPGNTTAWFALTRTVLAAEIIPQPAVTELTPTPIRPPQAQEQQYQAKVPKTIVELQQFRETVAIPISNNAGQQGAATLINLNPYINAWFVLTLEWTHTKTKQVYHLENQDLSGQHLALDPQYPYGIVLTAGEKKSACNLWASVPLSALDEAKASKAVYVPLCNDRLFLRNKTEGHKTTKEWTTDFLRNYIPGGEKITEVVKSTFYQDAFLRTSELLQANDSTQEVALLKAPDMPLAPLINPAYAQLAIIPSGLVLPVETEEKNKMVVGRWYRIRGSSGVFLSAIQPKLAADEVLQRQQKKVNALDDVEATALVYMVAFDLKQFALGFSNGTEHPRVDWSDRVTPNMRNNTLPGPDGIGAIEPLINTGMVNPIYAQRVAAAFVGGFRRYHGAFRVGELASKNNGSHYGVIEQGVVLSKLLPELATTLVWRDGSVQLKTWTEADNANLAQIQYARQNGVAIIEYDPVANVSVPGKWVKQWSGNWSGSAEGNLRTLRSGLAIQETETTRFLIFGYFSTATPSAMARVFGAYQCQYAMLLDMNALEHTYLALYQLQDGQFQALHLMRGMEMVDKSSKGEVAPRFIGYADNRDFFYLLRKKGGQS